MDLLSIKGVDIVLRPISILFFGCAMFFFDQTQLMLSFVSLLCHELCHVFMAALMGTRVISIEIMPYGGMARMDDTFDLDPMREFIISLAGPMSNIWLIVNALAANELWPQAQDMLRSFIRANMYIACVNLIPAFPLDGGRALRALLSFFVKPQRATRVVCVLGMAAGIFLLLMGAGSIKFGKLNLTFVLTGLGVFFSAVREFKYAKIIGIKKIVKERPKLKGINRVKHIAANENESAARVLSSLMYGKVYEISVMDENENEQGRLNAANLKKAVLAGARTMGDALAK